MAFMQHYMQMAAGQMDPAALQMAQYQMAAAQGLNFPSGFPGFPPPGMAEQVMAAYAAQAAASFPSACFPPYIPAEQQDPVAVAQQHAASAALANALYAQQQQQQPPQAQHQTAAPQSSAPEVSEQAAAAAAFALAQAAASYQGVAPTFSVPADHVSQHPEQDQQSSGRKGHQHASSKTDVFAQQQAAMPAQSLQRDTQQGISLSRRIPVKDDPAFGNGRLYRPQASHAKASVAPPSTKFGGAMNDSFQCASAMSRNSSSESLLPPASCCFEAAGSQVKPLKRGEDAPPPAQRLQ